MPFVLLALTILIAATSCRGPEKPARANAPAPPIGRVDPPAPSSSETPSVPRSPVVIESDPSVLAILERQGFDLGTLLVGARATRASDLAEHAAYRALADAVRRDLADDRLHDRTLGVGMRFSHRQFDTVWLSSDEARYTLVAVVNRLDRKVFAPEHCGEVRFVYRLGYRVETKTGPVESRLPMTVNVVYFDAKNDEGSCRDAALAWHRPNAMAEAAATDRSRWLASDAGPLSSTRRRDWVPKSVEVNFQSVRWPSTVRPSLGGHAEYVLRVFSRRAEPPFLAPAHLENTPDVARLARSPSLAKELADYLSSAEVLARVDEGTVVLPEKFLAERSVSVSPHGLARRANRPYSTVLDPESFEKLDLTRFETIATPGALLRRLDTLTCAGCHQSRSIAGFHMLGVEAEGDSVDAVHVPMSPHFHAEIDRRRAYVLALAEGKVPDERRPPPERGPHDDGIGARCGLGDAGFAEWTCRKDLRCVAVSEDEVGVCEPVAGPGVGDSCEYGAISPNPDSHRDAARLLRRSCALGKVCERTGVGFPGGNCSGDCDELPPGAVCGGIPLLVEFNGCLASGASFDRCIAENTRPGALRACSFALPCRDDYVCARLPSGGGACLPPYFLFQLRVDGHPL